MTQSTSPENSPPILPPAQQAGPAGTGGLQTSCKNM